MGGRGEANVSAGDAARGGAGRTRLRRANVAVGLTHLAQAAVILALSNGFAIPVVGEFASGPPGGDAPPVRETLFDVAFGPAVALFLLLAAADHLLVAAPRVNDWYEANLDRGVNYARWIEYSLSASVMVVLIAMLAGITGIYALIGLFAANAAMILFGLLMERENPPGRPVRWLPFWLGCIVGAAPWVAIAVAIGGAEVESGGVPGFVIAIFVSLFVLFNSFALNMALQYRGVGRWREYRFGEGAYLVLSLVAKSALAWQVFAGTLAA
jgi:hypothetical protein